MKRFRIGNDITIVWNVKKGGSAASLSGKTIRLYATNPKGREELTGFSVSGNKITYVFSGLEQKVLGRYTLTIDVREGDSRYMIQDKCGAFELVGRSCAECEDPDETIYKVEF